MMISKTDPSCSVCNEDRKPRGFVPVGQSRRITTSANGKDQFMMVQLEKPSLTYL